MNTDNTTIDTLLNFFDTAIEHAGDITKELEFKDCPEIEWDSLGFLTLVAAVQEDYGVVLTAQDVKSCKTIEDLFNFIVQKKAGNGN